MDEPLKTKSGWRVARKILIVLAVFATLIAIFYTEEDWRGKLAWENCKRQLEAQGVVLDWDKFIPPPVPDDQNFYTASTNILLRFKFHGTTNDPDYQAALLNPWLRLEVTSSNSYPTLGSPVVAKIIVTSNAPKAGQETNVLVVSLNDPAAAERARNLINAVIGPHIQGAAGFRFYKAEFKNIRPAQIYVQAEITPSRSDLQTLIPTDTELRRSDSSLRTLISSDTRIMTADAVVQKNFDVDLSGLHYPTMTADDYLKWSDQYVAAFDEIREALKRPYAILPGDYSQPYEIPIPNFVIMRALAQTLAQRAQCYLLLGEPDKALPELTLVCDVCRILEKPPTGQPETLVEAMINVAIHELYAQVIAEGMQRHAWQEPQLEAFQEQLGQINLPPVVKRSFAAEIAGTTHTLETISIPELKDWFSVRSLYSSTKRTSLERTIMNWTSSFVTLMKLALIPRGWIYQNLATDARLMSRLSQAFDSVDNTIQPRKFVNWSRELDAVPRPYKFIASEAIPNFTKAFQTTAYNQTIVNEAQIACALERYRLAHDEYPETLDALVPQFIQALPQDIIGGQPLHYRRTGDGKFLLYSVGWNETDDGGQEAPHNESGWVTDFTKGDWVWPN
jgi:hypothetical protein